jgi:hypothetical protein
VGIELLLPLALAINFPDKLCGRAFRVRDCSGKPGAPWAILYLIGRNSRREDLQRKARPRLAEPQNTHFEPHFLETAVFTEMPFFSRKRKPAITFQQLMPNRGKIKP